MKPDWTNLYKIRIANPDKSFQKHEIIKLILVMRLLNHHKREKANIHIYTEFVIKEGKKCDVLFIDTKRKAAYIFEIQRNLSKEWENEVVTFYKGFEVSEMNTTDLIMINLNNLSNDIIELNNQLDEYII